jgi:hypothetical protein
MLSASMLGEGEEEPMWAKTKYRIGAVLSAAAISTMALVVAGATTAGAAPLSAAAGTTTGSHANATPSAAMPGTYEVFFNYGSGWTDEGQLFLNSDTSWSLSNFMDTGTWETVGKTIGMSDDIPGSYPNGAAWAAKVKGTALGSASSPGRENAAGVGGFKWHAVFLTAGVREHAPSGGPADKAGVRPDAGATFPGTYNTFVPSEQFQTVYNSDGTWSQPGFCDTGTYLSFKLKSGTTTTFTVVMGESGACGFDELWIAKEHGTTELGTASKPGIAASAGLGGFLSNFYSVLAS